MSSVDAQTVVSTPLPKSAIIDITASDPVTLPNGFPSSVPSSKTFTGKDFANVETFVYHLTVSEIAEISSALAAFKDLGLDGTKIHKENFILPMLSAKLESIRDDVYEGRGFAVLRGLDPAHFPIEDLTMIYMGISSYVGDMIGRQDKPGNCLVHIVADKGNNTHHRHSTDPISFHTEETGEVVTWLTRGSAVEGGKCVLASAGTIYNILAASRPDLIRVLAAGNWPFAFPKFNCRPVIFSEGTRLLINFGRAALMGSAANPRNPCLPSISQQQREALDAIEAIARATEVHFATVPGDIHMINNMSVLHRRDGFVNDPDHERHLVRMRLYDSVMGSTIPEAMEREWAKAFGSNGDKIFHIEPMPSSFFPLRMYPN